MRTFDEYMDLKVLEPQIMEAAQLMMDLEINPEEFLQKFMEVDYWAQGKDNFRNAASGAAGAGLDATAAVGNLGLGVGQAAWNAGKGAVNQVGKSEFGQGIKNWWQDTFSSDAKMEKAAALIQKTISDPFVIQSQSGSKAKDNLTKIMNYLQDRAQAVKKIRQQAQQAQPQQQQQNPQQNQQNQQQQLNPQQPQQAQPQQQQPNPQQTPQSQGYTTPPNLSPDQIAAARAYRHRSRI